MKEFMRLSCDLKLYIEDKDKTDFIEGVGIIFCVFNNINQF